MVSPFGAQCSTRPILRTALTREPGDALYATPGLRRHLVLHRHRSSPVLDLAVAHCRNGTTPRRNGVRAGPCGDRVTACRTLS